MHFNKTIFLLIIIFCTLGCSKNVDFDKVKELPISTIEYTEIYDDVPITKNYSQADGFIFRDEREYQQDSCGLFISRTFINNEAENFSITFGFYSKMNADKVEENEVFLKDETDFDNHLNQEIIHFDSDNLCNIPAGQTGFISASTQTPFSSLFITTIHSDFELIKFDREIIRYEGLGYVVVDMEFSYTAIQFAIPVVNSIYYIPVTTKLKHAIRFPELDK